MIKINDEHLHACWYSLAHLLVEKDALISIERAQTVIVNIEMTMIGGKASPIHDQGELLMDKGCHRSSLVNEALERKYDTFNAMFSVDGNEISLTDKGREHFYCRDYDNPFAVHGGSFRMLTNFLDAKKDFFLNSSLERIMSLSELYLLAPITQMTDIENVVKQCDFSQQHTHMYDDERDAYNASLMKMLVERRELKKITATLK